MVNWTFLTPLRVHLPDAYTSDPGNMGAPSGTLGPSGTPSATLGASELNGTGGLGGGGEGGVGVGGGGGVGVVGRSLLASSVGAMLRPLPVGSLYDPILAVDLAAHWMHVHPACVTETDSFTYPSLSLEDFSQ